MDNYVSGEKIYLLCHSAIQVEYWLDHSDYSKIPICFLVTHADAAWSLSKRNLTYIRLEDYDDGWLADQIKLWLDEQIDLARSIDDILQSNFPQFVQPAFRPVSHYLKHLKVVWDHYIYCSYLLSQFIKKENPLELFYFSASREISFTEKMRPIGSVYAEILGFWEEKSNVKLTRLESAGVDDWWLVHRPVIKTKQNLIKKLLKSRKLLFYYITDYFIYQIGNITSSFFLKNIKIALSSGYDLGRDIRRELIWLGAIVYDYEKLANSIEVNIQSEVRETLEKIWYQNLLTQKKSFQPSFWSEPDIKLPLEKIFKYFWLNILPSFFSIYINSQINLTRNKTDIIAMSVASSVIDIAIIMAARSLNIPIVFYQHGASMGELFYDAVWDLDDLYFGDHLMLYGEGNVDYVVSHLHEANKKTYTVVGSIRLDSMYRKSKKLQKNNTSDRLCVLYVTDALGGLRRLSRSRVYKSVQGFETRQRVAELFNKYPQVIWKYKTFLSYGRDPSPEMINYHCPSVKITSGESLEDLLPEANILIFECPSTGLLEGMLTDKPIIVYADHDVWRLTSDALFLLRKRALVAETSEDFIQAIQAGLDGNWGECDFRNQEYVKHYGTFLNDGKSAERAANSIAKAAMRDK